MTTGRRDGNSEGTPFGMWLRQHPELDATTHCLSVTDCDLWVHKYLARDEHHRPVQITVDHLMLVEIKCFFRDLPYAQRDTLGVVDLILRKASVRNHKRQTIIIPDRRSGRVGTRHVRWLGSHVLQLAADRPDNSETMLWDGHYSIDEQTLLGLIRFDLDPDSPTRKLDTRRHHRRPFSETHPGLPLQ